MYPLNLSTALSTALSMTKTSASAFLCLTLIACSTTEQVNDIQLSHNSYDSSYTSSPFPHSHFTPITKHSVKKPLKSDHHLMMSLLKRPMTADQAMMLAFAEERARYTHSFANYANSAVKIKGDKASDSSNSRNEHVYAQFIYQDINAVSISGRDL